VLFDLDNIRVGVHNYLWWFPTKTKALRHKRWQKEQVHCAKLSAPIKYVLE
jgi:hypothetical protein